MKLLQKLVVLGTILSPVSLFAQAVDVSSATTAISNAVTAAGTVGAAGLTFAAVWIGFKYARRVFAKA